MKDLRITVRFKPDSEEEKMYLQLKHMSKTDCRKPSTLLKILLLKQMKREGLIL